MTEVFNANQIDDTIMGVERLYRAVTGRDVVRSEHHQAAIPAEKDPVRYVAEQIDRLAGMLAMPPLEVAHMPPSTPPMALWEHAGALVLEIEIPGVQRERVHLEVENDRLHVTGQRDLPTREDLRLLYAERPRGTFYRMISLPPGTLAGQVDAEHRDGVLTVRVGRATTEHPATRREVPIR